MLIVSFAKNMFSFSPLAAIYTRRVHFGTRSLLLGCCHADILLLGRYWFAGCVLLACFMLARRLQMHFRFYNPPE